MMFWKRNHNYSKIVYWKRNLFSFLFCVVLYLILIQYLFLIKLYILSPFSWKYNFQQCGYMQRLRTTTKVNTGLLVIFPCCIRRDLTEWQLLYLGKANQQLFSSGVPQFRSIQVLDLCYICFWITKSFSLVRHNRNLETTFWHLNCLVTSMFLITTCHLTFWWTFMFDSWQKGLPLTAILPSKPTQTEFHDHMHSYWFCLSSSLFENVLIIVAVMLVII